MKTGWIRILLYEKDKDKDNGKDTDQNKSDGEGDGSTLLYPVSLFWVLRQEII